MRTIRAIIKAKPPQPTAHVVNGHTVLMQGDVAYVYGNDGFCHVVHLPTAALALARPMLDRPKAVTA